MQAVLTIALQVGLIALLLLESRRMPAGTWNEDYFSLSQTKALQGLLALMIVFHHCGQRVVYSYLARGLGLTTGMTVVALVAFMFVGYFLFCSGYGLCLSLRRKASYLDGFLRRRPLPLLAVFYACNTLYLVARVACGQRFDAARLARLALGVELANPNAWYAVALPFLYVLFYVFAKKSEDDVVVARRLFVGTGLYVLLGTAWTTALSGGGYLAFVGIWWYDSAALFPLGYLFCLRKDAIVGWMKRSYARSVALSLALTLAGLAATAYLSLSSMSFSSSMPERLLMNLATVAIHNMAAAGFVWAMVTWSLKRRVEGRVLAFLGTITLELYLMHGFFVQLFNPPFYDTEGTTFAIGFIPAYILAVLACGLAAALAFRVLTRKLLR